MKAEAILGLIVGALVLHISLWVAFAFVLLAMLTPLRAHTAHRRARQAP